MIPAHSLTLMNAFFDALSAQKTVQHQTIEAIRQFNRTWLDQEDATHHPGVMCLGRPSKIDEQCDRMHDLVDGWWAVYTLGLTYPVSSTETILDLTSDTEDITEAQTTSTDDSSSVKDDLERIDGIEETYAARLREAGITTLEELASASTDLAEEIDVTQADIQYWADQASTKID